jgi:hypothetical protein
MVESLVEIREVPVVQAQEVHDRGVQVGYVAAVLHRVERYLMIQALREYLYYGSSLTAELPRGEHRHRLTLDHADDEIVARLVNVFKVSPSTGFPS